MVNRNDDAPTLCRSESKSTLGTLQCSLLHRRQRQPRRCCLHRHHHPHGMTLANVPGMSNSLHLMGTVSWGGHES